MSIDLSGLSDAFGLSVGATVIIIIASLVVIYMIQARMKDERKKIKFVTLSLLSLVILLAISGGFLSPEEKDLVVTPEDLNGEARAAWQGDYQFYAEQQLKSYKSDIANTPYYDYDNEIIATVAAKMIKDSSSAESAIKKTLAYVYNNVKYVLGESDEKCFDGVAPNILASGSGQCDTQSIVVISVLRKMGIAAKPVGGCIYINDRCRLQALFQSIQGFGAPRYTSIIDPEKEQMTFSRASGGLHAYIVAWLPEKGWVPLEATTGKFADTLCYNYHVELYPADDQKEDICVSKSFFYAKACQLQDLEALDTYGKGLVTEVSP